jgi:hypothetical protein
MSGYIYFLKLNDFRIKKNRDLWIHTLKDVIVQVSNGCDEHLKNGNFKTNEISLILLRDSKKRKKSIFDIEQEDDTFEYKTSTDIEPDNLEVIKDDFITLEEPEEELDYDEELMARYNKSRLEDILNYIFEYYDEVKSFFKDTNYYLHFTCKNNINNIIQKGLIVNPPYRIIDHSEDDDEYGDDKYEQGQGDDIRLSDDERQGKGVWSGKKQEQEQGQGDDIRLSDDEGQGKGVWSGKKQGQEQGQGDDIWLSDDEGQGKGVWSGKEQGYRQGDDIWLSDDEGEGKDFWLSDDEGQGKGVWSGKEQGYRQEQGHGYEQEQGHGYEQEHGQGHGYEQEHGHDFWSGQEDFPDFLSDDEGNEMEYGGKKRKTTKRKTIKRKTTKRKTIKRKTTKRKTKK